ncbi:MAG TPA: 30S ribosomal protein S13 [Methanothrix sp.]|nr:30S ribosomal protein S13 [Methanothrix sp.]HOV51794.1 30S ribosomal protein S13 [Methanothrix sp.]
MKTSGGLNTAKEKAKKAEEKPKKAAEAEELRHIVRILNTDLAGKRQVHMALTGIKGIGRRCARIFTDKAGVDPHATLGLLSDADIEKLKNVIEQDAGKVLPVWMVNRRGDIATGTDKHVMGMDLTMTLREDLDLMKKMRSYKGIRHERGLRVRGQRTRSTGRTGAIVGVSRKKEGAPAAAPAATKE